LEAAAFRRQMMLKTTKIILPCIDYWCANLQRLAKPPLGCAMILGLFFFSVSSAHAIPVRADLNYLQSGGSGNTLAGEAFFDTAALTGIGREDVLVDAFNFLFSDFGPRSAIIDTPSLDFVASFRDGEFIRVGAAPQFFTPDSALFTFSTDNLGRMIVLFRISGRRNYDLVSVRQPVSLTQTSVSEPAAIALFGIGLLGIATAAQRRRKPN
jgi:hypothetical protein